MQVEIAADWGADTSSGGTDGELDGDDAASVLPTGTWRWAQKFLTASLDGFGSVLAVSLRVNVVGTSGSTTHDLGPYGTDGTADPEAEASMATRFSASNNTGQYANDTPELGTEGIRTIPLSSTAVSHLQAARSGGRWSISARYTNEGASPSVGSSISEYDAGSNAPRILVLIEPGVTGTLSGSVSITGSITAFRGESATLSGSVVPTGSIAAFRGVSSTLSGSLVPTGTFSATHTPPGVTGTLSGSVSPTGSITAARGVSSTLSGSVAPTGAITAFRGESGTLSGSLVPTGAFSGTHSAGGVSGTLSGVVSIGGTIRGNFKSSRAAVKHYPADPSEPEVPRKLRPRRRRIESEPEPFKLWEMPARRPVPVPDLELPIPTAKPSWAPQPVAEIAPPPEPIAPPEPVLLEIRGLIEFAADVRVLMVPQDQLERARAEDQLILAQLMEAW